MAVGDIIVVSTTTGSYGVPDNRIRPTWFASEYGEGVLASYDEFRQVRFVEGKDTLNRYAYPVAGYWIAEVVFEPEKPSDRPPLVVGLASVSPVDMGDDKSPWGKGEAIRKGRGFS
ncbi:MAG: hypothetical protein AAB443_02665 [Patescibacteria group bacterium]